MRVYVAGPYTQGDVILNIRNAISAGEVLLNNGHTPFVPHAHTFAWHMLYPHHAQAWYDFDNQWLPLCEAVVRLPGASTGSDNEVQLAHDLGIPVYYGVRDFLNAHPDPRGEWGPGKPA